jgi:hypothetical protein
MGKASTNRQMDRRSGGEKEEKPEEFFLYI